MSDSLANMLAASVLKVTKDYSRIKKKEYRQQRQDDRLMEKYLSGRSCRVSLRSAVAGVMAEAYDKASGGGKLPANVRQIFYVARSLIGSDELKSGYFTQTLWPEYEAENPEETEGWDVVYDARGHFTEPHTGYEIGLGTIEVREYLDDDSIDSIEIIVPKLSLYFPTRGPRNRYSNVLYIEKEGFLPLLKAARFADRYDMAIMSSKGMGTVAARTIIERLSDEGCTIYVLHDFDKSGFSILGTLTRDTRRYVFKKIPNIVDLGLRLADIRTWDLESEEVSYDSDPTWNLEDNGATKEEIAFLYDSRRGGKYCGRRVELNALTSERFIEFLDTKLIEHGAMKVVPDAATLAQAYRRQVALGEFQRRMEEVRSEVEETARNAEVPKNLEQQIKRRLKKNPAAAWDDVLT